MPLHISGIGKIGEDVACNFLKGKGFVVIERNYLKKWGEIDIVAKDKENLYFLEVKTVTRENYSNNVSRETVFRPEENVHSAKISRLKRVIETYLLEKEVSQETIWKFGVITVTLFLKDKKAKVRFLKDIILE